MSKFISCADVGDDKCGWSATAETEAELITKIQAHAKDHHGFEQIPDDLFAKIKGAIKEK